MIMKRDQGIGIRHKGQSYSKLLAHAHNVAAVLVADVVALLLGLLEALEDVLAILLTVLVLESLEVLGVLDPLLLLLREEGRRTRAPRGLEEGRLHLREELLARPSPELEAVLVLVAVEGDVGDDKAAARVPLNVGAHVVLALVGERHGALHIVELKRAVEVAEASKEAIAAGR